MYISSHVDCATSGGLAEASFWVFVMQDIQFALAYQNPLRLTFSPFEEKLRQAWEARPVLDDRYWTHRAVWLLAETINFCYSAEVDNQLDVIDGDALREKICAWETGRPGGFQPLHFSPADPRNGRPFPVVWYTSPWHGTWHSINGRYYLLASGRFGNWLMFYDLSASNRDPARMYGQSADT